MPTLAAAVQQSRTSECLFDKPQTGPRPVKHFDALEFGLNSTFRIKAGPGYHMHALIQKKKQNKAFLHAKGGKIRQGRFTIILKELLQSHQPWLPVATGAAGPGRAAHGFGVREERPALLSSLL